jgi:hypothetical protein
MKKFLLTILLMTVAGFIYSQTIYYWVGDNNDSLNVTSNWNTVLNGTGTSRPSNTGATDILIFDGTNVGGGPFTVGSTGAISCAQLKYVNNANVNITRTTSGTTVITMAGDAGDDFFVDATSKAGFTSTVGSVRIDMAVTCTGRVNGEMSTVTSQQFRITNTTTGPPGTMVFTSGSKFYTNITGSSSYAFGSSAQASEKWVLFEEGSHLYYNGGNSPLGSGSGFSAIDMRPGSTWHHRATNTTSTAGNFFNRKSYGNIIVENNSALNALGTIYLIENLTIDAGSTFTPFTSGQTVVTGNIFADGDITLPAAGTNKLILAGGSAQTVSGSGTISVGNLTVADNADVILNKSITVDAGVVVYGKLNFNTNQITGNASFYAAGVEGDVAGTGNLVTGRYFITGNTVYGSSSIGRTISGAGIAPNTSIVSFSSTADSMYLSQPLLATASGQPLLATNGGATLVTSNANGFDPSTGSAATAGNKTYGDSINYIINAATASPFGITTGSSGNMILVGFVEINAPVTVNTGIKIHDYLTLNAKMTLRPLDILHIASGSSINGTFSSSTYIATNYNNATGEQSLLRYDGLAFLITLPIGTSNYYLPVTLNPSSSSDFTATVFEGITSDGTVNGTALTAAQKQTVVNAVWNINRLSGTGNADIELNWNPALEGSTFTTFPDTDIGVIANTGSSWSLPLGSGDNSANTVTATVSSFGAFSAGAVPPSQPFIFNPLPVKTYGDPDFNGGAISLNTTQPIVYSSSDPAVATIANGDIHITGAGTAIITASQTTDGFYPDASVDQTLTVNKAALTITADNKTKFQGQPNPVLTVTYTGFVLGETSVVLLTQPVITTTAMTASPAGAYPITVSGATSANYDISFINGTLTVQSQQSQTITFNALPTKTYGNANFAAGATSTNNTIPITYTSSNTSVATIIGSNIHIAGAGTTTITASQAGNAGYSPAADVSRPLTVNKAALTIKVRDTTKVQGEINPAFTITYTGFVLGETAANLTTPPTVTTMATTTSPAGYYTLTPEGASSSNYNFTYTAGRLTILPPGGTDQNHIHTFMSNSSTLTVRVYSTYPALADIMLFDLNGRPLVKKNVFLPQGFIDANIEVSAFPSGIYMVTVRGSGVNLKKTIPIIK